MKKLYLVVGMAIPVQFNVNTGILKAPEENGQVTYTGFVGGTKSIKYLCKFKDLDSFIAKKLKSHKEGDKLQWDV